MIAQTAPLTLPTDVNIRRHLKSLYRRRRALERLIESLEAYRRTLEGDEAAVRRAA